jgi:hypothetical protein
MLQGLAFLSLARLATLMWRYQNDAGPLPPCMPTSGLPMTHAAMPAVTDDEGAATEADSAPQLPAASNGSRCAANAIDEAAVMTDSNTKAVSSNILPQQHKRQRRAVHSTVQERE